MLVRIKPCYTFDFDGTFDEWAKTYKKKTFDVELKFGSRYYPLDDRSDDWKFFLKKELIFIKEKK